MREIRGGNFFSFVFFDLFLLIAPAAGWAAVVVAAVAAAVVRTVVAAAAIPSLFAQFTLHMEQRKINPMFQDLHHRRPDRLLVLRLNRQGNEKNNFIEKTRKIEKKKVQPPGLEPEDGQHPRGPRVRRAAQDIRGKLIYFFCGNS